MSSNSTNRFEILVLGHQQIFPIKNTAVNITRDQNEKQSRPYHQTSCQKSSPENTTRHVLLKIHKY